MSRSHADPSSHVEVARTNAPYAMPTTHAATYATTRFHASALLALARESAPLALSSVAKRRIRIALADPSSDLCDDQSRLDRLGEIGAEADLGRALSIVGQGVRRQGDDGDGLRTRVVAEDAS